MSTIAAARRHLVGARAWTLDASHLWLHAGLSIAVFAVTFFVVRSTYYFSDDFFLMFMATHYGPAPDQVFRPIFGHCVPGMLWLYWAIGRLGGLNRDADAVATGIFAAGLYGLTYGLAALPAAGSSMNGRRALAALLACTTIVATVPVLYLARGAATFPLALATLGSAMLLLQAVSRRNPALSVTAGLVCGIGYLFWELGVTNLLVVPLLVVALLAGRNGGDIRRATRELGARHFIAFLVPAGSLAALYAWNYVTGGYGTGVPHPTVFAWLWATLRWFPRLILPSIGGGPIPLSGWGPLPLGPQSFTNAGLWIPLVLGSVVVTCGLLLRSTRYLAGVVLLVALGHGAVTIFARWELEGEEILSSLRYAADMLPFYLVLFASLWLHALSGPAGRSRVMRVLVVTLCASTAVGLLSWTLYARAYGGGGRRDYVERSLASIKQLASGPLLLSGPVAPRLGWLPVPFDTTESVLEPAIGASRWRVGSASLTVLDKDGGAIGARQLDVHEAAAPEDRCVTQLSVQDPLPRSTAQRTAIVRLRAVRSGDAVLQLANDRAKIMLRPGEETVVHQTYGGISPVRITAPATGACILSVRAFVARPPE